MSWIVFLVVAGLVGLSALGLASGFALAEAVFLAILVFSTLWLLSSWPSVSEQYRNPSLAFQAWRSSGAFRSLLVPILSRTRDVARGVPNPRLEPFAWRTLSRWKAPDPQEHTWESMAGSGATTCVWICQPNPKLASELCQRKQNCTDGKSKLNSEWDARIPDAVSAVFIQLKGHGEWFGG